MTTRPGRTAKETLMVEELVRQLRWPEEAVCGGPLCKWPEHCLDCHAVSYQAMLEGRARFVSFCTKTPLDETMLIAQRMLHEEVFRS